MDSQLRRAKQPGKRFWSALYTALQVSATLLFVTTAASTVLAAEDENQPETVVPEWLQTLDYRGNLSFEVTSFTDDAEHTAMQSSNASVSGEIELYLPLADGDSSIVITPFARIDQNDSKRTHFDFRELLHSQSTDDWELRVGLGKVFWGVAESRNPVDIINQRDSVEGFSSDAKLGQPMVHFSWIQDAGSVDLFILPGFRERTFASEDGRPRGTLTIDADAATFESRQKAQHVDVALRYSTAIEEWDIGFSAFQGTSRDPLLQPVFGESLSDLSLRPHYYQVSQIGFDAQATLESWLLKFEWIYQHADAIDNHIEAVAGFEYSFYGLGESDADLGVLAEYLYDNRSQNATQPFQNDALFGFRLALNDEASSEALVGAIVDFDHSSVLFTAEASRRIANSFKATLSAVSWLNTSDDVGLDAFRNEDYLQAELAWFF